MKRIIEIFIKRRITTGMIFSGICLMGVISASKLPVELLPDIELPALTVITPFENAAPSEVEKLVTARIEEAVTSVSGVSEVRSESIEGMSIVKVSFIWGRDMDMALIAVREKVDLIRGGLPEKTGRSIVVKYDPSDEPVMIYSISLKNGDIKSTRKRAGKEIVPFLERINGVSIVELLGGEKREIHVGIDNAALYSKCLSLPEIVQAIESANYSYPAGNLVKDGKEFLVRTDGGFRNCADIRSVVAGYGENGVPVYLSDIASITDSFREKKSSVRFNGAEGVALLVKKEPGRNTIMTCSAVKKEIEKITGSDRNDFSIRCIYDQSDFIQSSIDNVFRSAVIGGIISFFVIWFFLKTPVPSLIISATIPVSVSGTMILMKMFNITINTMSLGGLAVGTGMMVDAGIVVLESIEDLRLSYPQLPVHEAAVKGTLDVAGPVTASILTSIIVFMPIVFLSGISGALFRDLALTVSFSLMFSLLSSLLFIPMISGLNMKLMFSRLNHPVVGRIMVISDRFMCWVEAVYLSVIRRAIADRKKVMALGAAAMFTGFFLFVLIDKELMPSVDPGEFSVELELPGGACLSETADICGTLENLIMASGAAENVFTKVGCDPDNNISEKISGRSGEYALIRVFMKKGGSSVKLIDDLQNMLKLGERVKIKCRLKDDIAASMISSGKSRAVIEISGLDEDALKESGAAVCSVLASFSGLKGITSVFDMVSPELRIEIDRKAAASMGLHVGDAALQLSMAVRGDISSVFHDCDDETDIRVRLLKEDRTGIDALNRILVKTGTGSVVPLSKFAEIKSCTGTSRIIRKEQSRINVVTADIIPGGGFIAGRLKETLARMKFREGVECRIADGSEKIMEAFRSLGFATILAVVFIYMLLAAQFQSLKNPLIIMVSIPVTALGVSLALISTGQTLNINSGIGMILLAGTVVNNAIVLFDFADRETIRGSEPEQALTEAGRKRLKPILMTTLTTILALVPVALGFGEGAELQRPLAVTVIGGMTVSTLLTLVFMPVLFVLVNERKQSGHGRIFS